MNDVSVCTCAGMTMYARDAVKQLEKRKSNKKVNMNTDRNGLYSHLFMPTRLFCAFMWIK